MFIGRKRELTALEKLYSKKTFEFMVLYGRRRIGKTSLLSEFFKDKEGVFYLSEEQNDSLNIASFCTKIYQYFHVPSSLPLMHDWNDIFDFIAECVDEKRFLLIIDEFPYLTSENKALMSKLQHAIDHKWKDKNIFLILCGSSVSFMENEVLGSKSPLFGRRTGQMKLEAFDYLESSQFYPNYSLEDKVIMYSIFGGIPQYLQMIDDSKSVEENVCAMILESYSYLYDEPLMLLKVELRNPSVYNSILSVMGKGATKNNDIASKIQEEPAKCIKYLQTLCNLGIVEKKVPVGEKENTRNTIYQMVDPFFHFWYRFIAQNQGSRSVMEPSVFYDTFIEPQLDAYVGLEFEKICMQFIAKQNYLGKLPINASHIGRWWGSNRIKKCQEDVDILLLNDTSSAIFCECKWRNVLFDYRELVDLIDASKLFDLEQKYYILFSKSGYTQSVIEEMNENEYVSSFSLNDLYENK